MGTSTFSGPIRAGKKGTRAGVSKLMLETESFDATIAASLSFKLSNLAVITGITAVKDTLDAPADTVDVGLTLGGSEIANELAAGAVAGTAASIAAAGISVSTGEIFVAVGATSTGTAGGTAYLMIDYYIQDLTNGVNG